MYCTAREVPHSCGPVIWARRAHVLLQATVPEDEVEELAHPDLLLLQLDLKDVCRWSFRSGELFIHLVVQIAPWYIVTMGFSARIPPKDGRDRRFVRGL